MLEAILATGLFVGAMAILGQLIDLGFHSVDSLKLSTKGLLLAESKLAEIVAGIEPILAATAKEQRPFPQDRGWSWSVLPEATEVPTLTCVTVIVQHHAGENDQAPDHETRLTRWVYTPPPMLAIPESEQARVPVALRQLLGLPGPASPVAAGGPK